ESAAYNVGAGVANVFYIPGKVLLCGLGGAVGIFILIVSIGSQPRPAAYFAREGCGGKWVLTGDDIRPEPEVRFDGEGDAKYWLRLAPYCTGPPLRRAARGVRRGHLGNGHPAPGLRSARHHRRAARLGHAARPSRRRRRARHGRHGPDGDLREPGAPRSGRPETRRSREARGAPAGRQARPDPDREAFLIP